MASGRPVVGTAVGGLREVVPDGVAGVIVDPRDEAGIADALARMIEAPPPPETCRRAAMAHSLAHESGRVLDILRTGRPVQRRLTIPEGLTSIGDYAFKDTPNLTSITLPSSVSTIGIRLFEGGALTNATFTSPGSLTTLPSLTFTGATLLQSITLPTSTTTIGDSAFYGLAALRSVTLPTGSTLSTIGSYAFAATTALTTITLPSSLRTINAKSSKKRSEIPSNIKIITNRITVSSSIFHPSLK
jgi:hypothetical protein